MLSESFFLIFLFLVSIQISSLFSSVLIIPISVLSTLMINLHNILSGLLLIIYIMVFISGLITLLISVASISFQDQTFLVETSLLMMLLLLNFFFIVKNKEYLFNQSNFFMSWLFSNSTISYSFIILLVISLIVITMFMQTFKGLIRLI